MVEVGDKFMWLITNVCSLTKKTKQNKTKAKKMLKDLLEAIYTGKIKDVNFSSWKYNIEGGAVEQIPLVNNAVGSDYMFC